MPPGEDRESAPLAPRSRSGRARALDDRSPAAQPLEGLLQSPHYPGTGSPTLRGHGPGTGRNLNLPVPPGLPASHYVGELVKGLDFALSEFTPEIIFISSGFDAAYGDPLAGLTLAPDDYARLTRRVQEIAAAHCEDRVISALEGGYDLENLAECGAAHVRALAGLDTDR